MAGILAPGLRGYLAAQQQGDQQQLQQMQMLQGILGMQGSLEDREQKRQLQPLQLQQLQLAVDRARANNELFKQVGGVLSGSPVSPMGALSAGAAQGDIGPTTTNAARIGQPVSPQAGGLLNAPPLIQSMILSGDTGMEKYGNAYMEQNKPIAAREGAPIINPATGQVVFFAPKLEPGMVPNYQGGQLTGVSNAPGYIPSMTERSQAQERVKAQYEPMTVPATSPTTPPTFRSREQVLQGAGAIPLRATAPTEAAGLRMVREADARGQPASVTVDPVPTSSVISNAAGMSPTQEAEVAARRQFGTKSADDYAKLYGDINKASMQNPGKIAKFNRIGQLLGDFEGGKLSKAGFDLAQLGNSVGVKIDKALPNKEAAEALSKEVALDLRNTAEGAGMPGAMSDADREFLRSMTPQMASTAEGRKQIIESRVALWQRENQVAEMARKYVKKYGQLNEDFFSQLGVWSEAHPVFKK